MRRRPTSVAATRRPLPSLPGRLLTVLLLGLLSALLPGCGQADDPPTGPRADTGAPEAGPVVAHLSPGAGDGMAALIQGPLELTGDCLLVGGYPVVWPHGTTWDAEAGRVRLPDGEAVGEGDRVSGGGGYLYLADLGPDLADPLAACPVNEYGEVAMFNPGEEITVG
ncbi:hypothetical protein [Nocardioides nanhaiensis]|uniref:Uncharacterized protein n=1 Tax=Nocardioides nanhaiensis TaxID=1476871 RepID=A0ABP8WCZ5_9ACTN